MRMMLAIAALAAAGALVGCSPEQQAQQQDAAPIAAAPGMKTAVLVAEGMH